MNSVIETIAAAAASPGDEPLPAQITKSLQKISIEMPSLRLEMKNPGDDIYLSDILKSNKMRQHNLATLLTQVKDDIAQFKMQNIIGGGRRKGSRSSKTF